MFYIKTVDNNVIRRFININTGKDIIPVREYKPQDNIEFYDTIVDYKYGVVKIVSTTFNVDESVVAIFPLSNCIVEKN